MLFLTEKRKARLINHLLDSIWEANYLSYEVRGNDTPGLRRDQMRIHVKSAFRTIERERRWWQRKPKYKPCVPVPCPAFEDAELEVEYEFWAAQDGGPGPEPR